VFLQEISESLIGEFLRRRHTVASKLDELVEGFVVEVDQFAHDIC